MLRGVHRERDPCVENDYGRNRCESDEDPPAHGPRTKTAPERGLESLQSHEEPEPRSQPTALVGTPCRSLLTAGTQLWNNDNVSKARYLEHLRTVPMFANCTKKQLDQVARIVTELQITKGSTLMVEGEMVHEFVIIESGTASVRRGGRKIATVGKGDVVGELALILRRPRTATVIADTDLNILVVDERSFNTLLDDVPGLARQLLHTVAERMADNAKPASLLN